MGTVYGLTTPLVKGYPAFQGQRPEALPNAVLNDPVPPASPLGNDHFVRFGGTSNTGQPPLSQRFRDTKQAYRQAIREGDLETATKMLRLNFALIGEMHQQTSKEYMKSLQQTFLTLEPFADDEMQAVLEEMQAGKLKKMNLSKDDAPDPWLLFKRTELTLAREAVLVLENRMGYAVRQQDMLEAQTVFPQLEMAEAKWKQKQAELSAMTGEQTQEQEEADTFDFLQRFEASSTHSARKLKKETDPAWRQARKAYFTAIRKGDMEAANTALSERIAYADKIISFMERGNYSDTSFKRFEVIEPLTGEPLSEDDVNSILEQEYAPKQDLRQIDRSWKKRNLSGLMIWSHFDRVMRRQLNAQLFSLENQLGRAVRDYDRVQAQELLKALQDVKEQRKALRSNKN